MKRLLFAILLPGLLMAEIWPEAVGDWRRAEMSAPAVPAEDRPLWDEYGLQETSRAVYANAGRKFEAVGWRLIDSTAALGVFDWQRPAGAAPSQLASLAAETADSLVAAHGNYVLSFRGYKPAKAELEAILQALRNVDPLPLPALPGFLPQDGRVPNSERFITGPAALQRFSPGIPPSVAGFHMGVEAQAGAFRSPKGEMRLAIFNYPNQQIAMQKIGDFQKLPGAMAKRSGPLIAVLLSPPDPDAAEVLLAKVRYQAAVTMSEYVPTRKDNIGDLVLTAFTLIGLLLVFSFIAGLFVGGFRTFLRLRKGEEPESMITLGLEKR